MPDEGRAGAGARAACLGASLVGDAALLANCTPTALSKKPPPEEVGLGEVGLWEVGLWEVGLVGVSDFLANWAPTALSKNPPPEEVGLEEVGLWEVGLGEAALVGASDFLANWAPTALSKNPPPEEEGLEVPATCKSRDSMLWFTLAKLMLSTHDDFQQDAAAFHNAEQQPTPPSP